MNVLAMNSGSSSLKFKVVEFDEPADAADSRQPSIRYEGSVEEIGPAARLLLRRAGATVLQSRRAIATHAEAVQCMLDILEHSSRQEGLAFHIEAVGHRVVHGGEQFRTPVRIDDEVIAAIDRLAELAPLHNPACLAGIKAACVVMGSDTPMVAVFDTAFHRSIPPQAATYAIDLDLARKHGIHRYGFHGIAHASLAASVPQRPTVLLPVYASLPCISATGAPRQRLIGGAR